MRRLTFDIKLKEILYLTEHKNYNAIKQLLKKDDNSNGFGKLYLSILLKGNGYWTLVEHSNYGAIVYKFDRKNYSLIEIFHIINTSFPVDFTSIKSKYSKFINSKNDYKTITHNFISYEGYNFDISTFKNKYIKLLDFSYIKNLIDNYDYNESITKGKISADKVEDFISRFIQELYRFKRTNPNREDIIHFIVKINSIKENENFREDIKAIRNDFNKGNLDIEYVNILSKIEILGYKAFFFSYPNCKWYKSFIKIFDDKTNKNLKDKHFSSDFENPWLRRQIKAYIKTDLNDFKKELLDSIDFYNQFIIHHHLVKIK